MASKAKKRKRSPKRKSWEAKEKVVRLDPVESETIELGWVRKGLLKSLISSLVAITAILTVYLLSRRG